ncbi:MAG: hypothetical protein ACM3SU_13090, partial [Acidobacteriota bacterium]
SMMVAEVRTSPAFAASRPRVLFEGSQVEGPATAGYDVSPDGQRFLMVRGRTRTGEAEVNVVLGWFAELRRAARREAGK